MNETNKKKISIAQLLDGIPGDDKHRGLDEFQRRALPDDASQFVNLVVTAGAGSGKTRTLSARYCWLVAVKRYKVEEILTLTFTRKAAAEMYGRIFQQLSELKDDGSGFVDEAVKNFARARIGTFDSFCGEIARASCGRYGVASDFVIDDAAVREYARAQAVPFLLKNQNNDAVKAIVLQKGIVEAAKQLFADPVVSYGSLAEPLNLAEIEEKQKAELITQWNAAVEAIYGDSQGLAKAAQNPGPTTSKFPAEIQAMGLEQMPESVDIAPLFENEQSGGYKNYLAKLSEIASHRKLGAVKAGTGMETIKKFHTDIKEVQYPRVLSILNSAIQWKDICAINELIIQFQALVNNYKQQSGVLSFSDVSKMALNALERYDDIRASFRDGCKAIMIDEFQDNNSLQRDIIKLLCNNDDGTYAQNKVFFVGDEKQSIFRFRGAEVSVFHGLIDDTDLFPDPKKAGVNLGINYRSEPRLVDAFNGIFSKVFQPHDIDNINSFEAEYPYSARPSPAKKQKASQAPQRPLAHLCVMEQNEASDDDGAEDETQEADPGYECEACYIAQ
jgi:ATP-dependent helicase/nuclease subunit A